MTMKESEVVKDCGKLWYFASPGLCVNIRANDNTFTSDATMQQTPTD
jgi:hypothetical protein